MLIYGCGVIFYENFEFDLESLKRRRAGIAIVFQHMSLGHDLVVIYTLVVQWFEVYWGGKSLFAVFFRFASIVVKVKVCEHCYKTWF